LNIVVNLILWALGVSAAVQMLGDVLNALEVAGNAGSVLTLQKGSAQMAILSSEALQALLEFITFKVLKGGIGKIADKVRERRAKDKDLSPQQAVEEEVGKAEGQTTTGKPPAAGVDEGLPKGEPAKAGKTAKEGEAAKEAEEVTSRQPVPAPTSLAERAEEFSDARLWSEVAEQTQKDFAGPATRLSARSLEYNRKVLMMMITKSEASVERARAARARVEIKLREAEAATDGDVIYRKLREAAAEVNKLHDKEVVQLQTHHEEWVSHHPATFPKTRAERIRARIRRRIKNGVANLSREERAIAGIADREKRIGVIREWAKAKLEHDVESGPAKLEEVEMDVLTREAHLSEVHGSH
jgi:hypothetical protein